MSDRPAQHIVAIGSGEGGVGKSTVSLHVVPALERRGLAIGLLDADVYRSDIPQSEAFNAVAAQVLDALQRCAAA